MKANFKHKLKGPISSTQYSRAVHTLGEGCFEEEALGRDLVAAAKLYVDDEAGWNIKVPGLAWNAEAQRFLRLGMKELGNIDQWIQYATMCKAHQEAATPVAKFLFRHVTRSTRGGIPKRERSKLKISGLEDSTDESESEHEMSSSQFGSFQVAGSLSNGTPQQQVSPQNEGNVLSPVGQQLSADGSEPASPTAAGSPTADSERKRSVKFQSSKALNEQAKLEKEGLTKINELSFLHKAQGLLYHVWESPEAAVNFSKFMQYLWKVLFDFHLDCFGAPISAMFCICGTYVSATAIPPLNTASPIMIPCNGGNSAADCTNPLHTMARQLTVAMNLHTQPELNLLNTYLGIDGGYYILTLQDLSSVARFQDRPDMPLPRQELMWKMLTSGYTGSQEKYMVTVAIPDAVEECLSYRLGDKELPNDKFGSALLTGDTLRNIFRGHGVNMERLWQALKHAEKNRSSFDKAKQDRVDQFIKACFNDMVARVLKNFARTDIRRQIVERKHTLQEEDLVDAVNRIARLAAKKDESYWNGHVVPELRRKFGIDPRWEVPSAKSVDFAPILRCIVARTGAEFSAETGRFTAIAEMSRATVIGPSLPSVFDLELEEDQIKYVKKIWDSECLGCEIATSNKTSAGREILINLTVRAMKVALMINAGRDLTTGAKAQHQKNLIDRGRDAQLRISAVAVDLPVASKKEQYIAQREASFKYASRDSVSRHYMAVSKVKCSEMRKSGNYSADRINNMDILLTAYETEEGSGEQGTLALNPFFFPQIIQYLLTSCKDLGTGTLQQSGGGQGFDSSSLDLMKIVKEFYEMVKRQHNVFVAAFQLNKLIEVMCDPNSQVASDEVAAERSKLAAVALEGSVAAFDRTDFKTLVAEYRLAWCVLSQAACLSDERCVKSRGIAKDCIDDLVAGSIAAHKNPELLDVALAKAASSECLMAVRRAVHFASDDNVRASLKAQLAIHATDLDDERLLDESEATPMKKDRMDVPPSAASGAEEAATTPSEQTPVTTANEPPSAAAQPSSSDPTDQKVDDENKTTNGNTESSSSPPPAVSEEKTTSAEKEEEEKKPSPSSPREQTEDSSPPRERRGTAVFDTPPSAAETAATNEESQSKSGGLTVVTENSTAAGESPGPTPKADFFSPKKNVSFSANPIAKEEESAAHSPGSLERKPSALKKGSFSDAERQEEAKKAEEREKSYEEKMMDALEEVKTAKREDGPHSAAYYQRMYTLCHYCNRVTINNTKVITIMAALNDRAKSEEEKGLRGDEMRASPDARKILDDARAKAPLQILKKLANSESLHEDVRDVLNTHYTRLTEVGSEQELEESKQWEIDNEARLAAKREQEKHLEEQHERRNSTSDHAAKREQEKHLEEQHERRNGTSDHKEEGKDEESSAAAAPESPKGGLVSALSFSVQPKEISAEEKISDAVDEAKEAKEAHGPHSPQYYQKVYDLCDLCNQASINNAKISSIVAGLNNRSKQTAEQNLSGDAMRASADVRKVLDDARAKAPLQILKKFSSHDSVPAEARELIASHQARITEMSTDQELEQSKAWEVENEKRLAEKREQEEQQGHADSNPLGSEVPLSPKNGGLSTSLSFSIQPKEETAEEKVPSAVNQAKEAKEVYGPHSPQYYEKMHALCEVCNEASINNAKIGGILGTLRDRSKQTAEQNLSGDAMRGSADVRKVLDDARSKAPLQILKKFSSNEALPKEARNLLEEHHGHLSSVTSEAELEKSKTWEAENRVATKRDERGTELSDSDKKEKEGEPDQVSARGQNKQEATPQGSRSEKDRQEQTTVADKAENSQTITPPPAAVQKQPEQKGKEEKQQQSSEKEEKPESSPVTAPTPKARDSSVHDDRRQARTPEESVPAPSNSSEGAEKETRNEQASSSPSKSPPSPAPSPAKDHAQQPHQQQQESVQKNDERERQQDSSPSNQKETSQEPQEGKQAVSSPKPQQQQPQPQDQQSAVSQQQTPQQERQQQQQQQQQAQPAAAHPSHTDDQQQQQLTADYQQGASSASHANVEDEEEKRKREEEQTKWYTGNGDQAPFYVRHWQPKRTGENRMKTPPHSIQSLWKELERIKLRKEERKGLFGIRDMSSAGGAAGGAADVADNDNEKSKKSAPLQQNKELAPPPRMKLAPVEKRPSVPVAASPSPTKSVRSGSQPQHLSPITSGETGEKTRLELLREEAQRLQGVNGAKLTKSQLAKLKASSPALGLTAANVSKSATGPSASASVVVKKQPPIHRRLAPVKSSPAPMRTK